MSRPFPRRPRPAEGLRPQLPPPRARPARLTCAVLTRAEPAVWPFPGQRPGSPAAARRHSQGAARAAERKPDTAIRPARARTWPLRRAAGQQPAAPRPAGSCSPWRGSVAGQRAGRATQEAQALRALDTPGAGGLMLTGGAAHVPAHFLGRRFKTPSSMTLKPMWREAKAGEAFLLAVPRYIAECLCFFSKCSL